MNIADELIILPIDAQACLRPRQRHRDVLTQDIVRAGAMVHHEPCLIPACFHIRVQPHGFLGIQAQRRISIPAYFFQNAKVALRRLQRDIVFG
ncbi:hypothetical protein D3C72_865030 [compost metagenome]